MITVCRGCCCGNVGEHPAVDAAAHLDQLTAGLAGRARLRITDCLDVCDRSNVIVVSPSPAGRAAGARPLWLGRVLDAEAMDDIVAWAAAGGPGIGDPPATLDLYAFAPSRRVREAGEVVEAQ